MTHNPEERFLFLRRGVGLLLFVATLLVYWLTVEPTASYWDCPEYIAVGSLLEIGHPPGNPTWMLAARMASMLAPSPQYVALAVNLTSGLFTALAALLLYLVVVRFALGLAGDGTRTRRISAVLAGTAGALLFAWSDTAWFSAVEAEVYAFSIFCTALCLWLMLRWAEEWPQWGAARWIVLTAYVTGLSIGVHQLNLLCIPALALIYVFRRRKSGSVAKALLALAFSFLIIALILFGMMRGTVDLACEAELIAVNSLGLPYQSGVLIYVSCLAVSALAALFFAFRGMRAPTCVAGSMLLWLSGAWMLFGDIFVSAILSAACGAFAYYYYPRLKHAVYIGLWCLTMLLVGFSTYSIILIRGAANPSLNEGAPTDIFAFRSYLQREQYGSRPLFYGPTPNSRIMRKERLTGDSLHPKASYTEIYKEAGEPSFTRYVRGMEQRTEGAGLTAADSAANATAIMRGRAGKDAYVLTGRRAVYRYTPELNMWFPRITSGDPEDLRAYGAWSGMTAENMDTVEISEAVDADGRSVGRLDPVDGKRVKGKATRPTYLHNLAYLGSYQLGYMYFRYLLWNFSGRQNDVHSTGEADHGNFITGIPVADDAMLGKQSLMPAEEGRENPGRHVYFMIPLLIGVAGLVWQLTRGREGKRQAAVAGMLFIMTGIAIAFYLNQTPGEPRERDYSFIGSVFAYAIWCGLGTQWFVLTAARLIPWRRAGFAAGVVLMLALPAWMLASNYKDHDRSGRTATADYAANILNSREPDAIIFVNGDNYTFPLWYAREVEGIRPDVRIVNIAYLSTPWYVSQMMIADRASAPLPFTATEADIASGSFALTGFGAAPDDTVNAVSALKALYSRRASSWPSWSAAALRIAPGCAVRLSSASTGSRQSLTQPQLMMLDIVATNAASSSPRPVYWVSRLPGSHFAGLRPFARDEGLVMRFVADADSASVPDSRRFLDMARNTFRWGGADREGVYFDCTAGDHLGDFRKRLILLGRGLLQRGDTVSALEVARLVEDRLPDSAWSYRVFTDKYVAYSEAVELALIYGNAAKAMNRPELRERAFELLRGELSRLRQWRKWRNSLPGWRLNVMSPRVRLESGEFIAPAEAWIELGGGFEELKGLPAMKGVDFSDEKRRHLKSQTLRKMLRCSRYPGEGDDMDSLYRTFRSSGGTDSELGGYVELSGFTASPR